MEIHRKTFNPNPISACILIALLAAIVLAPVSPANMSHARRDSGVFLYSGWRIINGGIPYKDFWDHKPPVIYFINTIGLLITGQNRWGVWGLEYLSLFIGVLIGFHLYKKAFNTLAAALATILWLVTMTYMLGGGNLTTEFSIPLQFACLYIAWQTESSNKHHHRYFFVGVLSSILFTLKQNTTGIAVSIVIYLLLSHIPVRRWRTLRRKLVSLFAGSLLIIFLLVILFLIWGALPELWDAAFIYNFIYAARPSFQDHAQSLFRGWLLLSKTNIAAFGIFGWSMALANSLINRSTQNVKTNILLRIGLISLPIELAFASLGGRLINHYFLVLLPSFSLFTAYFFFILMRGFGQWIANSNPKLNGSRVVQALILLAALVISVKPLLDYIDSYKLYRSNEDQTSRVVDYVKVHSSPDDFVLALEAETYINFASRRRSPTKYVYQYPLRTPGYTTHEMVEEFLEDILSERPKLIVVKVGKWIKSENYPVRSNRIDHLIDTVNSLYNEVEVIGEWAIYAVNTS